MNTNRTGQATHNRYWAHPETARARVANAKRRIAEVEAKPLIARTSLDMARLANARRILEQG